MPETTIAGRQIRDGAITNAKIAARAGIESSKLADGANFIKKDGSVAFTGNQSMGNNKLTTLATPTDSGDATTKAYVDNLIAGLPSAYRYRNVKVATTANIDLSNPGTSTIDGVSLSSGDRVLVKDQSTASQNGIYDFNGSSSAMTRSTLRTTSIRSRSTCPCVTSSLSVAWSWMDSPSMTHSTWSAKGLVTRMA